MESLAQAFRRLRRICRHWVSFRFQHLDFGPSLAILEGAMLDRSKKHPRDPNQLAHQVFLESIGEATKYDPDQEKPVDPSKNPHAVAVTCHIVPPRCCQSIFRVVSRILFRPDRRTVAAQCARMG